MEFKKNIFYYLNVTFFILWSVYMLFTKMILSGVDVNLIIVVAVVALLSAGAVFAYDKVSEMTLFEDNPMIKVGIEAGAVVILSGVALIVGNVNASEPVALYQNLAVLVCMVLSYGIARFFSSFAVFSLVGMLFWPTLMSRYAFSLEGIMKVLAVYAAVFVVAMIFSSSPRYVTNWSGISYRMERIKR